MSNNKKEQAKVIGEIVAQILKFGVNIAQERVEKKIDNPLVEKGVLLIFPLTKDLIEVLSDKDPNNEEQVRTVMLEWTNGPLADYLEQIFTNFVAKQKDENAKVLIAFFAAAFIEALRIYSDDVNDNKKQLDKLLDDIVSDKDTYELILNNIIKPLLVKSNASEELSRFVVEASKMFIDWLLKEKAQAEIKTIEA
jgi:hypothetical protein